MQADSGQATLEVPAPPRVNQTRPFENSSAGVVSEIASRAVEQSAKRRGPPNRKVGGRHSPPTIVRRPQPLAPSEHAPTESPSESRRMKGLPRFFPWSGDAKLFVDFLKHCADPWSAKRETESFAGRLKSHGGSTLSRFGIR